VTFKKIISDHGADKNQKLYGGGFKVKFGTAADLAHEYGTAYFLNKIMPWHLHRTYEVYSQSLDKVSPDAPAPYSLPFRIAPAAENEFEFLMRLRPGYYKRELFEKRLALGHFCYLGWNGDQPIHIRWVFTKSVFVPYFKRRLVLAPGEVYVDEAFTAPSFRGNGIFFQAGKLLRQELKKMGFRRYICAYASWNSIPIGLAEKSGLARAGEIQYWNFPWVRRVNLSDSVRDMGKGEIVVDARS